MIYEENYTILKAGKNNKYSKTSLNSRERGKRREKKHFWHTHGPSCPFFKTPMTTPKQSKNAPSKKVPQLPKVPMHFSLYIKSVALFTKDIVPARFSEIQFLQITASCFNLFEHSHILYCLMERLSLLVYQLF